MHPRHWQLTGTIATWNHGDFRATLDTSRPAAGLHELFWKNQPLPGHLLGVSVPPAPGESSSSLVESYAREGDIVAIYEQPRPPKFRHQIYWRSIESTELPYVAAWELIVSVQTELLASRPRLTAGGSLASSDLLVWREASHDFESIATSGENTGQPTAPRAILWRLADSDLSYVELPAPGDSDEHTIAREGLETRCDGVLFAGQLEKGVILRARRWGLVLPRHDDTTLAKAWRETLLRRQLPLTT